MKTLKAQLNDIYDAEVLMIRAGQHLFREWRDKGRTDKDLEASFECIWQLKRELRVRKRELLMETRLKPIPEA